jgi:hypothetical protein
MVELDWLMMCYAAGRVDTKPLVILYGAETSELSAPTLPTNIRAIRNGTEEPVSQSVLRIRDGLSRIRIIPFQIQDPGG